MKDHVAKMLYTDNSDEQIVFIVLTQSKGLLALQQVEISSGMLISTFFSLAAEAKSARFNDPVAIVGALFVGPLLKSCEI